jgi:hypothetical protein
MKHRIILAGLCALAGCDSQAELPSAAPGNHASPAAQRRIVEPPIRAPEGSGPIDTPDERLRALPPLSALHGDGFRLSVLPRVYAQHAVSFTLPMGQARAQGMFVTVAISGKVSRVPFTVPQADYLEMMQQIDAVADHQERDCMDGTYIAFERVRGARITHGFAHCELTTPIARTLLHGLAHATPALQLGEPRNWGLDPPVVTH